MAYTTADFRVLEADNDVSDSTVYTTGSQSYVLDQQYLMWIGSESVAEATPEIPTSVVTDANVVWSLVDSEKNLDIYLALYAAKPTANTTSTTVITFTSTQNRCNWQEIEVDLESQIIQYTSGTGTGLPISITLPAEPDTESLVLSGYLANGLRVFTPGLGQTALTFGFNRMYTQYNLGTSDELPCTVNSEIDKVGIGVELLEETVVSTEPVTTRCTIAFNEGNATYTVDPVICQSTLGFNIGMTAELWPAGVEANKETATDIVAVDPGPASSIQLDITFTVAPDNAAGDIIKIIYDDTVGDITSVTGDIALTSTNGTYEATLVMVC